MPRRLLTLLAAAVATLALAAAAQAHVTVHPNALPAGGEATLWIDVPNESSTARTVEVDVKFPPGFVSLLTEPVPGWTARVVKHKLAKPITTDDGTFSVEVGRVIWKATGRGIGPGQFLRLPFSVAVPDRPGAILTFKALQIYSNRKVVRWIGPPRADEPAPRVLVTPAGSMIEDYPGGIQAARRAVRKGAPRR